jgi:hypothetical protein
MDEMNITSAKYVAYDGVNDHIDIPLDPANTEYIDLQAQIDAGDITVGDADPIVT